jgi:1-acyl-sn-glycerol-3-phosphate acyltransferase
MSNASNPFTLRRKPWAFRLCLPLLRIASTYHHLVVEGTAHLPREGPGLLFVKHRSTRDTLLLSWLLYRETGRTANYLMKYRAAGLPPQLMEALGAVAVIRPKDVLRLANRAERRARLEEARAMQQQAMDYVAWLYAQGELVVVYPEGMFYPQRLGPVQTGSVRHALTVAQQTGLTIPIIPVGIAYERLNAPRSRAFFRIGEPRDPTAYPALAPLIDALKTQLRALSYIAR